MSVPSLLRRTFLATGAATAGLFLYARFTGKRAWRPQEAPLRLTFYVRPEGEEAKTPERLTERR